MVRLGMDATTYLPRMVGCLLWQMRSWTPEGILVRNIKSDPPSIEDEPEFVEFLTFLAKDALAHPKTLVDPDDLLVGVDALLEGVARE